MYRVQHGRHETDCFCHTHNRRCITSHHAHWVASLAPQFKRGLRFGTLPLESGAVVPVLVGCPKFTDVSLCSSGSHLAVCCHRRRGPFIGTSGYFFANPPPFLFAYSHFTSQTLMFLDLNGRFHSLLSTNTFVD